MSKLIIRDISPDLNGEYEYELGKFKNRELHFIKQETGVRAGEMVQAFRAGDNDLLVAIAAVVLARHGKGDPHDIIEVLWDADTGGIDFEEPKSEEDKLPPVNAPGDGDGRSDGKKPSGVASDAPSDPSQSSPKPTGELT